MSETRPGDAARLAFVPTRWEPGVGGRGDSPETKAALGDLCEAYWLPVFRFIKRGNHSDEGSRELTQEFFARLLAHDGLSRVDPTKGRFRSYLLGAVKTFLAD